MVPFPAFPIPDHIHALVKKNPDSPDFTEMLLKLAPLKVRTNPESYHLSFSTKLYLEEADSQHKKFDPYNINKAIIEHISADIFRFKVDVSSFFIIFAINKLCFLLFNIFFIQIN